MLQSMRRSLAERSFKLFCLPSALGSEATLGSSHPFVARLDGRPTCLPVNAVSALMAAQCVESFARFSVGKLFWQHSYNNRFSLSEINTLDVAMPWATAEQMMDLVDSLLLHFDSGGILAAAPRRLEHLQAMAELGLASDESLSIGQGQVLAARLGVPAFWIVNGPAQGSPYYTAVDPSPSGAGRARSFELWLGGVPNVVAGSVWASETAMLNPTAADELMLQQRRLIRQGLPPGVAATIGLDRLAMALLGTDAVRDTLLRPRSHRSFREDPPLPQRFAPPVAARTRDPAEISRDDARGNVIAQAMSQMAELGFLEVQPSALSSLGDGFAQVDWYGRAVSWTADLASELRSHIALGMERVMAAGVVADADSQMLRHRIEAVATIGDDTERLRRDIQDRLAAPPGAVCLTVDSTAMTNGQDRQQASMPERLRICIDIDDWLEGGPAARLARAEPSWRCGVCGYRCVRRPSTCPVCLASGTAFVRDLPR
jgi:hypothetical protein